MVGLETSTKAGIGICIAGAVLFGGLAIWDVVPCRTDEFGGRWESDGHD